MAWYRKTTPSSYPSVSASNFTDSSKNWRQYKNIYRRTSDLETASLTAVPGRYTDSTRTWRRVKAIYRYTSSGTWQKIFGKFAGQPYPEVSPAIRYSSYDGVDVGNFAMMGPGSESIAQGSSSTTYLWGKDGQNWQNIESLASRVRTFMYGSTPVFGEASAVTNDEGNWQGDKLRNAQSYIEQYDGQYIWYMDRCTLTNGSTGTSYSQTVRIIKQRPVINSLAFKTNNSISVGSNKYVTYSVKNEWYRSIDRYTSVLKWYILDTQYETPTESKLYGSTQIAYTTQLVDDATTLSGEDYFNIPETFNGSSTIGKWLHVKLICKNSSSDTDVDYMAAPYNDVTDYIVSQISGAVPSGTNATVTVTRVNTSYEVKVDSGNTGTWSNSPTSYRYQWYIQEQTVGSAYTWSPISGATSSTYDAVLYKPSDTSTTNRIVPVVWASNANGESNDGYALTNSGGVGIPSTAGGITIANPTSSTSAMIKYKLPVITTFTVTGGTRKITYVTNFSSDDPSATASVSYSGAAIGSFTPTSSTSSVDRSFSTTGTYNFTLTVTNASTNALSGSTTATQNNISITGVTVYDFNFGNVIYQSTNAYSSFDDANYKTTPVLTTGRVLSIYPQDMSQGIDSTSTGTGYLLYWSNADEYVIQWTGFRYGYTSDASYQLRYQIRYYKDQAYADIKYLIKGSNLTTSTYPGMYYNGEALGTLYTGAITQGTTLRVYFDGSTPLAGIAFTEVPNSAFINAGGVTAGRATPANADDSYTTLTTVVNQFVTPKISITSITAATTSLSVDVDPDIASSYSYYSYDLKTGSHNGTSVSSSANKTDDPLSITGLTANTTYYLTITPYNGMGQSGPAVQDSKATLAAIPSTPTTITVTPDDEDSISLDWDDMTGAASYEIYYTTTVTNIPNSSTAATVDGITNSNYQLTGAASNTTYYFFIRARSSGGASAYSSQKDGKTAPAIPTGFSASATSSSAINLTWTNVSGVSASNGYEIYRSITTTNPSFSTAATITDSGTPYSDTGLSANTDYYYWIRSTNGTTKSNWSSRITAKTSAAAAVPSGGSVVINGLFLGNAYVGDTISATTSGWSGSPTSYTVNLRTSTSTVNESSTSLVSNSPNTSATTGGYVVTSSDAVSPANNFKAFAYASNASGTSTVVSSATAIAKVNSGTAPGIPTALVNGWTGGTNYPFSWTAPTSTGKDKDGTTNATISYYLIEVYEATSNTGTGATLKLISAPSSTSYTYTSSSASAYAAFKVQAVNSAGKTGTMSGYSAWK